MIGRVIDFMIEVTESEGIKKVSGYFLVDLLIRALSFVVMIILCCWMLSSFIIGPLSYIGIPLILLSGEYSPESIRYLVFMFVGGFPLYGLAYEWIKERYENYKKQ